MTELLGDVPSWIAFQEKERVAVSVSQSPIANESQLNICVWCALQWLNLAMKQMWPYYDKAVAAAIKESVEPIMDQYKPAGIIKRIYFKTLTFGDTPMVIDSVWLENEGENHVLMEARVKQHCDCRKCCAAHIEVQAAADRFPADG